MKSTDFPGLGTARLLGEDFAQHALALGRHLFGGREPLRRTGVRCTDEQPVERLIPLEQRHVVGVGQSLGVAVIGQVDGQLGQRPADGVDVRRDRRTGPHDLGCLKSFGAVDVSEVPDAGHRPHVDQLDVVLGEHDVVRLEIVVDQAQRVQVAQRRHDLEHITERLLHRHHRLGFAFRRFRSLLGQDGLQRGAADVLHHDVADGRPSNPGCSTKL